MDKTSNTGKNRQPGTFIKGDKRINRNGRPKSFDKLRALAQRISCEVKELADGSKQSTIEGILREWATGTDKQKQQAFIEIGYGKVPTENIVKLNHDITLKWDDKDIANDNDNTAEDAPASGGDIPPQSTV